MKTLADCDVGELVQIIQLKCYNQRDIRRMTIFGMLPGAFLKLIQKYPVYVVKNENTEVAMDVNLAKQVLIKK